MADRNKRTTRKVLIMGAGGTIDKIYGEGLGVVDFSFSTDLAIAQILRKVKSVQEYPTIRVLAKDSMHMDDVDRQLIANMCAAVPYEGILISHGTDTMKRTAETVAAKKLKKTIVIMGAGQPAVITGSDADFNTGFALSATLMAPNGVFIAMNARLYEWDTCEKNAAGIYVPI